MKSKRHESITRRIVEEIYSVVETLPAENIKHGAPNRWLGTSGHKHQLDVTVLGQKDLIVVECKCWENSITCDQVLAFAGRICDISQKSAKGFTIHPILVTKKGVQSGAKVLAKHFSVELCTVQTPKTFAVRYKHLWSLGLVDKIPPMKDAFRKELKPSLPK